MTFATRFAPSPTGPLHLGHAYSAGLGHDMARAAGGTFHLRIEDLDRSRARPEWEDQIFRDLHWLGFDWPVPVMRQSARFDDYRAALSQLWRHGVLYSCSCNRRDIAAAVAAPQETGDHGEAGVPRHGPDGLIYPGTCRDIGRRGGGPLPDGALRLDAARAFDLLSGVPLTFTETGAGPKGGTGAIKMDRATFLATIGDVVLSRRDLVGSYHLAVTVDDAALAITHVVRGRDLFDATMIHVLVQRLLGLATPVYHHHRLIRDEAGKRLAKRDDARAIAQYRSEGMSPDEVRALAGLAPARPAARGVVESG